MRFIQIQGYRCETRPLTVTRGQVHPSLFSKRILWVSSTLSGTVPHTSVNDSWNRSVSIPWMKSVGTHWLRTSRTYLGLFPSDGSFRGVTSFVTRVRSLILGFEVAQFLCIWFETISCVTKVSFPQRLCFQINHLFKSPASVRLTKPRTHDYRYWMRSSFDKEISVAKTVVYIPKKKKGVIIS